MPWSEMKTRETEGLFADAAQPNTRMEMSGKPVGSFIGNTLTNVMDESEGPQAVMLGMKFDAYGSVHVIRQSVMIAPDQQ